MTRPPHKLQSNQEPPLARGISSLSELRPAPEAWRRLEAEFSAALRAPLRLDGGQLRAPEAFGGVEQRLAPPDTQARLALYHEQHWMRLFGALHRGAARTCRALGYFRVNRLAERYLRAEPPRSVDLGELVDGFLPWLERELELTEDAALAAVSAPRAALHECIAFDRAERKATVLPEVPLWTPSDATLARLASSRLVYAPSFTLLAAHFAVRAGTEGSDAGVDFVPLAEPRWVACARRSGRVEMRRVAPTLARLLAECEAAPLGLVLARWQTELSASEVQAIGQNLGALVRRAVTSGYWVGLESESTSGT